MPSRILHGPQPTALLEFYKGHPPGETLWGETLWGETFWCETPWGETFWCETLCCDALWGKTLWGPRKGGGHGESPK